MDNSTKVKRVLKNPVKFEIQLNDEQKHAKEVILANKITVLKGKAGTGKTQLASAVALDLLLNKGYDKIILCRPAVEAGESIGYLPGNLQEKLDPYVAAIYDCLIQMRKEGAKELDTLIRDKKIEIIPIGYMRGRNLSNAVALIDESQNLTKEQTKLILTRICEGSKIVFCGDYDQCDLKKNEYSGFEFLSTKFNNVPDFATVELKVNHRDPIVDIILQVYEQNQ